MPILIFGGHRTEGDTKGGFILPLVLYNILNLISTSYDNNNFQISNVPNI